MKLFECKSKNIIYKNVSVLNYHYRVEKKQINLKIK